MATERIEIASFHDRQCVVEVEYDSATLEVIRLIVTKARGKSFYAGLQETAGPGREIDATAPGEALQTFHDLSPSALKAEWTVDDGEKVLSLPFTLEMRWPAE